MRKRNVKAELAVFPCFEFKNGRLIRIPPPQNWYGVELHHFITTQWEQEHPQQFEEVKHLQKLIFLPKVMHRELHNKHSKFKEKYGIEIKELLFDWREYMISADKARAKSNVNKLKLIEKLINKAVEKGLTSVFKQGQIPKEVQEKVIAAGYDIELCPAGMRISWG